MIQLVLCVSLGLFALGGIGMFLASRKVAAATRRRRWIKYFVYILVVYSVIGSSAAGAFYFSLFMLSIAVRGAYELFAVLKRKGCSGSRLPAVPSASPIYLLLSLGLLLFASQCDSGAQIFVYLTVAVFDGFSQVAGQIFGRHHFAPRISPNKSLEGTLGGLTAACLTVMVLRSLIQSSSYQALLLGIVLSLTALAGDLLASWCKRICGVKDFGTILPGHGGILDRFDSLFTAATMFWLLSWLVL